MHKSETNDLSETAKTNAPSADGALLKSGRIRRNPAGTALADRCEIFAEMLICTLINPFNQQAAEHGADKHKRNDQRRKPEPLRNFFHGFIQVPVGDAVEHIGDQISCESRVAEC